MPCAVSTPSIIIRLSRIDSPGRVQMVPKRWSTVSAKYSPGMSGISQP